MGIDMADHRLKKEIAIPVLDITLNGVLAIPGNPEEFTVNSRFLGFHCCLFIQKQRLGTY